MVFIRMKVCEKSIDSANPHLPEGVCRWGDVEHCVNRAGPLTSGPLALFFLFLHDRFSLERGLVSFGGVPVI